MFIKAFFGNRTLSTSIMSCAILSDLVSGHSGNIQSKRQKRNQSYLFQITTRFTKFTKNRSILLYSEIMLTLLKIHSPIVRNPSRKSVKLREKDIFKISHLPFKNKYFVKVKAKFMIKFLHSNALINIGFSIATSIEHSSGGIFWIEQDAQAPPITINSAKHCRNKQLLGSGFDGSLQYLIFITTS